jgi:O-antigen ligase
VHFGDSRYAAVSLAGNIGDLAAYLVLPLLLAQARLFVAFRHPATDSDSDSGKKPRPTDAATKTRIAALFARLGWQDIAWIAGAAVWLGAFLAVQVLTAVAALLVASAAFWLLVLDRRQRIGLAAVGLVAVVVLLVVTPVGDRVASEWSELRSNGLNAALTGRLDGWRAGLQVGKSHPVLGAGPGSYAAEFAPAKLALLDQGESFYRKHGPLSAFRNAHNEPIEIFAELGILGLLGAAWLLWWTVRGATAVPKPEHRALAVAAIVGLFVLSLGHFPLRSALVGYPYLVAGAWLLSLAPPLRRADKDGVEAAPQTLPRRNEP